MAGMELSKGGEGPTLIFYNLCQRLKVTRPEIDFKLKTVTGPRGGLDVWEGTTSFQVKFYRSEGRDKKSVTSDLAEQILGFLKAGEASGEGLLGQPLPRKKTKRGKKSWEAKERKKREFLSRHNIVVKNCTSCGYPNYVRYSHCGKCSSSLEENSFKAQVESSEKDRSPSRSENQKVEENGEKVEQWKMERDDGYDSKRRYDLKSSQEYKKENDDHDYKSGRGQEKDSCGDRNWRKVMVKGDADPSMASTNNKSVSTTIKQQQIFEEVEKLHRNVASTVMKILNKFYPSAEEFDCEEPKICSSEEYSMLAKQFSQQLYKKIMESYEAYHGSLEAIVLTGDHEQFIRIEVESYFEGV